jgi:hypothetical protein
LAECIFKNEIIFVTGVTELEYLSQCQNIVCYNLNIFVVAESLNMACARKHEYTGMYLLYWVSKQGMWQKRMVKIYCISKNMVVNAMTYWIDEQRENIFG